MLYKRTRGELLVVLFIVCCFFQVRAEYRNEQNQQTFVVRYKSGDQTIPVTVVLDYRKQTEYVINMNHRAPTKTVTLYDFKQRTIAYKDLTNRECFLRQLTNETLNEETDSLNRVQNPVKHEPKLLSLDPHRASLTPTEIRNMAGQKTAVFCRKMNTWLILPKEDHSIRKREVDEEIDEVNYHRHGYHTVHYSHYGRETRRRFRNSKGNSSLLHRNEDASEFNKENIGNPKAKLTPRHFPSNSKEYRTPGDPDLFTQPQNYYNEHLATVSAQGRVPSSVFHSENQLNSRFGENKPHSNNIKNNIRHETSYPYMPGSDPYSNREDITPNQKPPIANEFSNLKRSKILSSLQRIENENDSHIENAVLENKLGSSTTIPEYEFPASHKPKLGSSFYRQEVEEPMASSSGSNHHYILENHQRRGIETEGHPGGLLRSIPEENSLFNFGVEYVAPENTDAPINALDIPKVTKQFENLDRKADLHPLSQTDEDIHELFQGFHNLKENHLTPEHSNVKNSQSIPLGVNRRGEHTYFESSLRKSYPLLSYNEENSTENDGFRTFNTFSSPIPYVIDSTDYPSPSTIIYDEYKFLTTPFTFPKLPAPSVTIPTNIKSGDSSYRKIPSQYIIHDRGSNQEHISTLPTTDASNVHHDIRFQSNKQSNNPYDTNFSLNKFKDNSNLNQRSDIPSENESSEIIDSFVPVTIDYETSGRGSGNKTLIFPTPFVREGASPRRERLQNALMNYKPDQIIINIEKIPTQRPPDSTSGFEGRIASSSDVPLRKTFFNRSNNGRKNGIFLEETRYSDQLHNGRLSNGRTNNFRKHFLKEASFRPNNGHHRSRNQSNFVPFRPKNNNIYLQAPTRVLNLSHQYNPNQRHQLNVLPPGVSIHPRHPKAPYADMYQSNMLSSVAQNNDPRTLKPHRQRHHRKKDQLTNPCCGTSGKANGNLSPCCKAGGSCCSGHRGRNSLPKSTCCSSTKHSHNRQMLFHRHSQQLLLPQQNQQLLPHRQSQQLLPSIQNDFPTQQAQRTVEDNRDRCQKEKMCRTLYESTQQVMVCRNADIDGCS